MCLRSLLRCGACAAFVFSSLALAQETSESLEKDPCIAFDKSVSESFEKEARIALNKGDFNTAALKFERAAEAAGEPARRAKMLLWASWSHFNAGHPKDAQEVLCSALRADWNLDIEAGFFSAGFMELVDKVRSSTCATSQPADLAELKRVAREKLRDGNFEDVLHDFLFNVPRDKLCTDAEALELLADAYQMQGNLTMAEKLRAAANKLRAAGPGDPKPSTDGNPENREKLVALGQKARADGDLVHARQVFKVAAEVFPEDVSVLTEHGIILLLLEEVDAALKPLMKAAAVDPDNVRVHVNLAWALRRNNLWRDAEKEYREAIRCEPEFALARRGLGSLLLELGRAAEAIEPLRRAVLRDAANPEGQWALARAQRLSGNLKDAAETLQRARELGSAEIANEAGAVACARGRYSEAVELFGEALAKEPASTVFKANREKAAAAAKFLADSGTTPALAEK